MAMRRLFVPGIRTDGDIPSADVGTWLCTDHEGRYILEVSATDSYDAAQLDLAALILWLRENKPDLLNS